MTCLHCLMKATSNQFLGCSTQPRLASLLSSSTKKVCLVHSCSATWGGHSVRCQYTVLEANSMFFGYIVCTLMHEMCLGY